MTKLICAKCGEEYLPEDKMLLCVKRDDGRLDIHYDYQEISQVITKKQLETRTGFWKYFPFFPLNNKEHVIQLSEGNTPLLKSRRLAKKIGLNWLYLKDETRNPTASFKDRPMAVGISKAVEFQANTIVCASSGNAAAAAAAYSAKADLNCVTFVPEHASAGKIAQLLLYGASVFRVQKLRSEGDPTVQMLKLTHKEYGWYPCPSFGPFNPYQAEGAKTIAYEIAEQLGWRSPDWIYVPVGGGGLLAANWKGFKEFNYLNFIPNLPKMVGIQSEGCAPLVKAFQEKTDPFEIKPWKNPNTVAKGLADPLPWDGDAALQAISESEGIVESVLDSEILEAQRLLAKYEGVFAEPSGVASLAGLIKHRRNGLIDQNDTVVIEITGSGLKDPSIVNQLFREPPLIKPGIKYLKF